MAIAGRKAVVNVSGGALVFTNEATTANVARTVYTITNTVKRVWDRIAAITVQTSPDGGTTWNAATGYTINRLKGQVTFGVANAVGTLIRVSGSYLPLAAAVSGKSYKWELSATNIDNSEFGFVFINRSQGLKSASGSIGQWKTTDTTLTDLLLAGSPAIVEFWSDGSATYDVRLWALFNKAQINAAVEGLVTQDIEFESTPDLDGNVAG